MSQMERENKLEIKPSSRRKEWIIRAKGRKAPKGSSNKTSICIIEIRRIILISHERIDSLHMNGLTIFLSLELELE